MSNDLWRWADPNGQQRNVRLDELRAALAGGHIAPNAPVWRAGWSDWQPAHEVPELTSASVGGANGVVLNIPPPPLAMVAVQQKYEAASESIVPEPPGNTPGAPVAATAGEPPPPPAYVPLARLPAAGNRGASTAPLKTQIGGSPFVPSVASAPPSTAGAVPSKPGGASRLSQPTVMGLAPAPATHSNAAAGAAEPPARPRSLPPPPPGRRAPDGGEHASLPFAATSLPDPGTRESRESIEELSGSILLESSSALVADDAPNSSGFPPPTNPIVRNEGELDSGLDESYDVLPRRRPPGLDLLLADIEEMRRGRPPKNKLVVGIAAGAVLVVFVLLVSGIVGIASGTSSQAATGGDAGSKSGTAVAAATTATASEAPTTAGTTASTVTAPVAVDAAEQGRIFGSCAKTGDARTVSTRAVVASAIEASAAFGGLALGFATSAHDAVATSLAPSSLAPMTTVRSKIASGDVRRVTPLSVNGKLTALADVDRKGDRIASRRVVSAASLVDVGWADSAIVWAPHGKDSFARIFAVDGDAPVEALRVAPLADKKGLALAFRQGTTIRLGAARGDGTLVAEGDLAQITGGAQVGSPALTVSGDRVVVAWAERHGPGEEWTIRWTSMKLGGAADPPSTFTLPSGGLGGQAMSPSLASLGGGRALLAWAEGAVANHQVRAAAIGPGASSSDAIVVSADGVNAGQPSATVGADGNGVVAFLAAKGKAFEVQATPIACTAR